MQQSRRKTAAIVTAVTLAVAILLTGTFAWRSISQQAKNEIIRAVNPGGRLHDDFNGENKDIYVENFFTTNEGGQPIFARVRLDEYMEQGPDAGINTDDPTRDIDVVQNNAAGNINIKSERTWIPYNYADQSPANNKIRDYWKLTMGEGAETVFMPTFNKNKDSLSADINGTYAGLDKDKEAGEPFDDYVEYKVGDTKKDFVYQDADSDNNVDEYDKDDPTNVPGGGGIENTNYKRHEDTHTAKLTGITKKVWLMTDWVDAGSPMGPYWVFDDTDTNNGGWFYWAQPIMPGQSTGLLLDKIEWIAEDKDTDDPTYYAINVVGQFATAGDWGTEGAADEAELGFYNEAEGEPPTDAAIDLLNHICGDTEAVMVKADDNKTTVAPGETLQFSATVKDKSKTEEPVQTVKWSLVEAGTSTATKVDETTGELTVGADETAKTLTVRATSTTTNKTTADYMVKVEKATATTP